ncbi:MAG TPA: response regulator [Vicinamibacterales bacterium]|nr:response regulator [Vicinamibacterales bacterium]
MSVPHYTSGVRPRVLIVDDYVDALDAWQLLLQAAGFEVITAATGEEALSSTEQAAPAVIVLDVELPGLSGLEVAQRLRADERTRRIPLIATTGRADVSDLMGAGGFDAVLIKPCDPATLVSEIRRLTGTGHVVALPEQSRST